MLMDIVYKMSTEFRNNLPPAFELGFAADMTYIEEQAALSKRAFHGIQVLKLDIYDHNIVQMGSRHAGEGMGKAVHNREHLQPV